MNKHNTKHLLFAAILILLALSVLAGCKTKKNVMKDEKFLDILISGISETASFYNVSINEIEMEIIAVTASDNTIRIALNRCERCYKFGKGYIQDGGDLICLQCSMRFNIDKIGIEKGGCAPISIPAEKRIITEDMIKISHEVLKTYIQWFLTPNPEQTEKTD